MLKNYAIPWVHLINFYTFHQAKFRFLLSSPIDASLCRLQLLQPMLLNWILAHKTINKQVLVICYYKHGINTLIPVLEIWGQSYLPFLIVWVSSNIFSLVICLIYVCSSIRKENSLTNLFPCFCKRNYFRRLKILVTIIRVIVSYFLVYINLYFNKM